MATGDSRHDVDSVRTRTITSIKAAASLLAIYTALYLAIAGMIHFLTSPDAIAAIVPERTKAHAAAASELVGAVGAAEVPPDRSFIPASERTDNSRECRSNAAIDSECIFN